MWSDPPVSVLFVLGPLFGNPRGHAPRMATSGRIAKEESFKGLVDKVIDSNYFQECSAIAMESPAGSRSSIEDANSNIPYLFDGRQPCLL